MASLWKISVVLHLLYYFFTPAESGNQYVEPLNSGLQFSIPYDMANIFNRPIATGITVFLAFAMCFILFFGVITSPFGYMFGIPSRKYVLGSESDIQQSQTSGIKRSLDDSTFDVGFPSLFNFINSYSKYDVTNSMFFLLPQEENQECNNLMICYAHGIFKKLPKSVLKFYQLFSRKLLNGNEKIELAVKTGLKGFKTCDHMFSECPFSPFKLLLRSARRLLPQWWGKRVTRANLKQ